MVDFADSTKIDGQPDDDTETRVALVQCPNLTELNAPVRVWGWVAANWDADATTVTVTLTRDSPSTKVLATVTYAVAGSVDGPPVGALVVDGVDDPGQLGTVSYAINVTVADASGPSVVSAVGMHARYNYAPQPSAGIG